MNSARRPLSSHHQRLLLRRFSSSSSSIAGEETPLIAAINDRNYAQIPKLLLLTPGAPPPAITKNNPFSFLSLYPPTLAARIISDLLRSSAAVRPRSAHHRTLSHLLAVFFLPDHRPSPQFPIAMSVLRSALLSGLRPSDPAVRRSLPSHWLSFRRRASAETILSSISPCINTCNYLVSALCAASEPAEALAVLRAMPGAGVDPDRETYGSVAGAVGWEDGEVLLKEMVERRGMSPPGRAVRRVVTGMRQAGESRRAAELVMSLNGAAGFEGMEEAVKGCIEAGEVVLAARVSAAMAGKGFLPGVFVRRRVVERLAAIGELELATDLRRILAGESRS